MKRRVVVTGLGAVTPIGNTVDEFWNSIKEGKVGIGEITKFDTTDYKVRSLQKSKALLQKSAWTSKRPDVWSRFLSMRLRQQRKLMRTQGLTFPGKILTGQA